MSENENPSPETAFSATPPESPNPPSPVQAPAYPSYPEKNGQAPPSPPNPYCQPPVPQAAYNATNVAPPPYGSAPGFYQPVSPPKKPAWPWVLGGCLLALILILLSMVCCAGIASSLVHDYATLHSQEQSSSHKSTDQNDSDGSNLVTTDEIEKTLGLPHGSPEQGKCAPGVYTVGEKGDIAAGIYFLEGSQTAENNCYLFQSVSHSDKYSGSISIVYFGNYFVDLKEGQVIAFAGSDDLRMYASELSSFKPQAPYQSGLYRVGTDIPEGTYTILPEAEAAETAHQDCAAYVMKDLSFSDDSITQSKYVIRGGSQTVTVKKGEWLELYAATATPQNDSAKS